MLIRVINGMVGYRPKDRNGEPSIFVQEKRRGDLPFEVDPDVGERLVRDGIAEAVVLSDVATPLCDEAEPGAGENLPYVVISSEGQEEAHLDPGQLEGMTVAQLKIMATDMGLDISGCKKKSEIIDLITAEGVEAEEDGEAPPDLSAEAPVV